MRNIYLKIFFIVFFFISCKNKPESCDGSSNISVEASISFTPRLLPISLVYSSNNGLSVTGTGSIDVGCGTISFSTTLSNPDSKHNVVIILRNRNDWGDKTYYLENTDNVKVYIKHGSGEQTIDYYRDQLIIDFTNESYVEVDIEVNNVFNPDSSLTNRQLRITAEKLNARFNPGKDEEIFTEINKNEYVEDLGVYEFVGERKWILVCHNNYKVWVSSKYVESSLNIK